MDNKNETGLGVQNRFDLLSLDDPLNTQKKKSRRRTKKNPKKQVKTIEPIQNNEKPSQDQAHANPNDKPGSSKKVLLPKASTDTFLQKSVKADKKPNIRQMTFEEYRAKNKRLTKEPIYNTRLPGEGEDSTKWEKLVPLEKTKLEQEEVVVEDNSALEYLQRDKRQRRLHLNVRYNDRITRYGISRQIFGDPDPQPGETKPPGPPIVNSEDEFPNLRY